MSELGIKKENIALGVLEQLELVHQDVQAVANQLRKSEKVELESALARLTSIITLFDDETFTANMTASPKISRVYQTKIERMGLARQVIRMRQVNKMTYGEIASSTGVDANTVSRFCRYYDEQTPREKSRYQRASVFDTATQYEDIASIIYRQLARLEDSDAENHVKYVSEMRQLLKQAKELMDQQRQADQIQDIKQAVVQILQNALPEQRDEIMKQFSLVGIGTMKSVKALGA